LTPRKIELEKPGEYFNNIQPRSLPLPLDPAPTSYIAREHPLGVFHHSCLPRNRAVSTFGAAAAAAQVLYPKLEETSDDDLPAAATTDNGEFERSRLLSCPEMQDSRFLDERLMFSADGKLQLQPATASEILCAERGMQFLEEDMMFNNLAGLVVDGLCLQAPPPPHGHILDGDEGVHYSTWEHCLWSF